MAVARLFVTLRQALGDATVESVKGLAKVGHSQDHDEANEAAQERILDEVLAAIIIDECPQRSHAIEVHW